MAFLGHPGKHPVGTQWEYNRHPIGSQWSPNGTHGGHPMGTITSNPRTPNGIPMGVTMSTRWAPNVQPMTSTAGTSHAMTATMVGTQCMPRWAPDIHHGGRPAYATTGTRRPPWWAPSVHPMSGTMGSRQPPRCRPHVPPTATTASPPAPRCPLTAGGRTELPGEVAEPVDAAAAAGGVEPVEEIVHPGGGRDGEVGPGQRQGWQEAGGTLPARPRAPRAPLTHWGSAWRTGWCG